MLFPTFLVIPDYHSVPHFLSSPHESCSCCSCQCLISSSAAFIFSCKQFFTASTPVSAVQFCFTLSQPVVSLDFPNVLFYSDCLQSANSSSLSQFFKRFEFRTLQELFSSSSFRNLSVRSFNALKHYSASISSQLKPVLSFWGFICSSVCSHRAVSCTLHLIAETDPAAVALILFHFLGTILFTTRATC